MVEFNFERTIDANALLVLLRQTHWAQQRTANDVQRMLGNSTITLGGYHDDQLVAFARALTDGHYRALIDDVIVDADHRGQGVGTELMRRMAERLSHVEEVFLRCEPEMTSFYERLGYQRNSMCMDLVK